MEHTSPTDRPDYSAGRSILIASSILALLTGTSVYILGRDWATVLFLAPVSALQPESHLSLGSLGAHLPSLCHAYAFALLITVVLWPAKHARLAGALLWLFVAAALECLQAEPVAGLVAPGTGSFAGHPIADGFLAYMMNGYFDVADLAATALGVSAAYVATSILGRKT